MNDIILLEGVDKASEECLRQLAGSFDPTWGGFGGAPKFPRSVVFNFLLGAAVGVDRRGDPGDPSEPARSGGPSGTPSGAEPAGRALQMAVHTLRQMAAGGIHDHVGGGFHRYSVDAEWFVPHFEKMLYDQAQLAVSYLEARQATDDERYAWVARDVFDYVLRDLAHPVGGFYSAEDADSEKPESGDPKPENYSASDDAGELIPSPPEAGGSVRNPIARIRNREHAEGAFYVWTKEEIVQVLEKGAAMPSSPADEARARRVQVNADFFCAHFDVKAAGNVSDAGDPHGEFRGKNILRQRRPLPDTAQQFGLDLAAAGDSLQAGLVRLREARSLRPRPPLDDKIITAWNGLMISALAKGYQVLGAGDYLAAAVRAAEFIRRELYDEAAGVLYRSFCNGRGNVPGFAGDYAYLIQGLLDLYEAAFDIRWLQWAGQLQAVMDVQFWDAEHGGYFDSRAGDSSIIARLKENYDGAEPAPSSVAALNLWRLEIMIGNDAGPGSHGLGKAGRALQCVEAFRSQWTTEPNSLPQMLSALVCIQSAPRTVVIAGDPGADDFRALAAVMHERLGPRHSVLAADQAEGHAWLARRRSYLAEMKPIGGRAAAYVCENFTCQQPVTDPAGLRRIVWG
jgi:hypothetical protein